MATETQDTQLALPRKQLAFESHLSADIPQVMGRRATQGEGTAHTEYREGNAYSSHECPSGHGFLAPKLGGSVWSLFLLTAIEGFLFQGRMMVQLRECRWSC